MAAQFEQPFFLFLPALFSAAFNFSIKKIPLLYKNTMCLLKKV